MSEQEVIRVFIVEDDFMVAKVTREFTEKVPGFGVVGEARTGLETLEFLKHQTAELVIMDVYVPDKDGLELLREFRNQQHPLDVIMVTAAKEMETVQECLRLGVFDYICKPFGFERYQASLQRYQKRLRVYDEMETCTQPTLDELFGAVTLLGSTETLPKGLQQETLEHIIRHLKEIPFAQTCEEIAQKTSLSKATIQRYLRYLVENDQLQKELTYGTQGRPEHKYYWR